MSKKIFPTRYHQNAVGVFKVAQESAHYHFICDNCSLELSDSPKLGIYDPFSQSVSRLSDCCDASITVIQHQDAQIPPFDSDSDDSDTALPPPSPPYTPRFRSAAKLLRFDSPVYKRRTRGPSLRELQALISSNQSFVQFRFIS